MKLFVTGGLGFIGSNFIINILKNYPGYSIVNLDDELEGSNHMNLESIKNYENYTFVKGNICNQEIITKYANDCDIIINFAAESHVDRSISNAKPFINTNIVGITNILEVVKDLNKKLIQISTDEVFGSLTNDSAKEDHKLNPSSPYASSKAAAELLVNSYVTTYGCDCIITRCTNNYGPRQFPEKLIPKTILLAHNDKKIPIYGNGKNIRDWIYVDDHCDAILEVIKKGRRGESYNVSSNNELDNLTIVKKILKLMEKSEDLIEFVEDRPGHDLRYSLDSTKIRKELGWNEKMNFDIGIEKTVKWYLDNLEWWNKSNLILEKKPWV